MEYVDELMDDENNKGILLYVDSPGGAVYESEELYDKLMEYKKITKQPIWTYMAHYAASGGYMASVSSDKIYANKSHEAFVSKVADGRKISKEQVKKLADGRTYTATQAKNNGLIENAG